MGQQISGPGLGLPLPQNLYPTELNNAALDIPSNKVSLASGEALPVPAGNWYLSLGYYLSLEYQDPITGLWAVGSTAGWSGGTRFVKSDGYTLRIANRTACPIGAAILAQGSGYAQASTTIAVTGGGGSQWTPIIGGALSITPATIVTANAGAGYGIAPLMFLPPPAPASNNSNGVGGLAASGYAQISGGTISGFSFTNVGAGYTGTTFNVIGLANPMDPNLATGITLGTVTFTVGSAGLLTGVFCNNSGAPLANPANITLTVSGVGTGASINAIVSQVVTSASLVGGTTLGSNSGTLVYATTVGGYPNQGSITGSPDRLLIGGRVRPAQIALVASGAGVVAAQVGAVYDGGYFYSTPSPLVITNPLVPSTGTVVGQSTLTYTMGGLPDIATYQPAP